MAKKKRVPVKKMTRADFVREERRAKVKTTKARKFSSADLRAAKAVRSRRMRLVRKVHSWWSGPDAGIRASDYRLIKGKHGYYYALKGELFDGEGSRR